MKFYLVFFVAVIVTLAVAKPQGGGGGGGGGGGSGGSGGGGGGEGGEGGYGGGEGGYGGSGFITPVDIKKETEIHFKANPEFKYEYKVEDPKTKDYKTKKEEREGYKVKGSYSLLEPDHKTIRVVDYTSDKKQGFVAKVYYKKHE